jgi:hypothetical protein
VDPENPENTGAVGDPTQSAVNTGDTIGMWSVVIGSNVKTIGADNILLGGSIENNSYNGESILIGNYTTNDAYRAIIIGNLRHIYNSGSSKSISIGVENFVGNSETLSYNSIVLGSNSSSVGGNIITIGANIENNIPDSVVIGNEIVTSLKLGPNSFLLDGTNGMTFNEQPKINNSNPTAANDIVTKSYVDNHILTDSDYVRTEDIFVDGDKSKSIHIGENTIVNSDDSIAIGLNANANVTGENNIAIGRDSRILDNTYYSGSNGDNDIVIGVNSTISGKGNIGIGENIEINGDKILAIGQNIIVNNGPNCINIGQYSRPGSNGESVTVGNGSLGSNYSVIVGNDSISRPYSVIIGSKTQVSGEKCVYIGAVTEDENNFYPPRGGANCITIGFDANTTGQKCIAIGSNTNTGTYENSIAIGSDVISQSSNSAVIGNENVISFTLGPLSITFDGDDIVFTKGTKSGRLTLVEN